jgi:hypothetical protein
MKFLKLFTLLALLVGVWAIGSKPAAAASCYQEYVWCVANAEGTRDDCYTMCSGIIACEAMCYGNYTGAIAQCESDYSVCED